MMKLVLLDLMIHALPIDWQLCLTKANVFISTELCMMLMADFLMNVSLVMDIVR